MFYSNTRKYSDIAYSFLIGSDGSIFEGRGYNKQGAHTYGYNSVGYGITFIGDFATASPTSKAISSFNKLANVGQSFFRKIDFLLTKFSFSV